MQENQTVPSHPTSPQQTAGENTGSESGDQKSKAPIGLIIGGLAILVILIAAIVLLATSSLETTGKVRDIFIIFMALESLVIGVALIILIVQLATLINLLQNEIRPIIKSTNETINTLRGTVAFISENLTQPVIQLNDYLAGIKQFFDLMRPGRTKR